MPDTPDLIEFLKNKTPQEAQDILKDLSLGFDKFAEKYKDSMGKVIEMSKSAGASFGKTAEEITKSLFEIAEGAKDLTGKLATSLGFSGDSIKKFGMLVTDVTADLITLSRFPPPASFGALNKLIGDTDTTAGNLTENVSDLIRLFNIDPKSKIVDVLNDMAKNSDAVKQAESSMIQVAAASGQLSEVLGETGDNYDLLERKMVAYSKMNTDVALATGLSTSQVEKFGSTLFQLPGALSANIMGASDGSRQYGLLDAALKTATGSGMSFKDVFGEITDLYNRFGDSTSKGFEDSLRYVSALQDATNELKIPLQFIKSYTDQASASFKFFGNNSEAAIRVVERLGPALKNAKLGPEAIKEMLTDITGNLGSMNLAQRSFLSSSSGGAGGLQGGYQIELLKSQGKFDEIQKMAETSLMKQFGGRIVTLEDAAKDEGAARQLTKQVQLITSGPTKLVNNEAEAYKFFEAMKGGMTSPIAKDSDTLLQENLEKGAKFEERNNTLLNTISAYAQKIATNTQLSLNQTVRATIGPGEGDTGSAEIIRAQMREASTTSANNPTFPTEPGLYQPRPNENIIEAGENVWESITNTDVFVGKLKEWFQSFEVDKEGLITNDAISPATLGEINDWATKQDARDSKNNSSDSPPQQQSVTFSAVSMCPDCQKTMALNVAQAEIGKYNLGQIHANHMGQNLT